MPYKIVRKDGKYAVETKATHKTHGWTTKPKAEAQKRILDMIMKKTGK